MTLLRADMHVHTCHSRYNDNIPLLGARDCYSRPEAVYAVAKARGMDLVAITDHDTIDGALALAERMPDARDIIVGEEVSCWMPCRRSRSETEPWCPRTTGCQSRSRRRGHRSTAGRAWRPLPAAMRIRC